MNYRFFSPSRSLALPFAAVSLTAAAPAFAGDELEGLRQQIAELQQAVEALEQKEADTVRIRAGAKGLRIESSDGAYRFSVNGLIQLDHRSYLDQSGAGTTTFDLRRVRPTFQGQLGERVGFRFTPELAGSVRILDAYGDFRFAEKSTVRFGNFKTPVGLERLQGAANLPFNERGYPTEFTPARDLGIQLQTRLFEDRLIVKAGLFNGAVDGSNGSPNLASGDLSGAGSLFFEPFKNDRESALHGFGVGISGSYGRREGNAGFRVRGPSRLDLAANSAILEDGNFYRVNPSVYYYRGPFGVLSEYILSSRELFLPGNNPEEYTNHGWVVEFSYILTGEDNGYGGIQPRNPVKGWGEGGLGAWELALRYSGAKLDGDLFDDGLLDNQQARKGDSWGIGLNWYLTENLKAMLSAEYTEWGGGSAGFSRSSDTAILSRLQVAF